MTLKQALRSVADRTENRRDQQSAIQQTHESRSATQVVGVGATWPRSRGLSDVIVSAGADAAACDDLNLIVEHTFCRRVHCTNFDSEFIIYPLAVGVFVATWTSVWQRTTVLHPVTVCSTATLPWSFPASVGSEYVYSQGCVVGRGRGGTASPTFFYRGDASPTPPLFWTEIRAKVSLLLQLVTY